jgi:hypothetical protein
MGARLSGWPGASGALSPVALELLLWERLDEAHSRAPVESLRSSRRSPRASSAMLRAAWVIPLRRTALAVCYPGPRRSGRGAGSTCT